MKKFLKTIKENLNGIILCLLEILVGVLLLIDPLAFTAKIIMTAGIVLIIIGAINIAKYFRVGAPEASAKQYCFKGLVALAAGIFCAFHFNWLIATFPAITFIYGTIILIAGLGKIQLTLDMVRSKQQKWFLALISAVISVVCGMVILNNPFASSAALWIFTGVSLIAESIIDLLTLTITYMERKGASKESA